MHRLQRQWIIKYCDDAETVTAAAAAVMQLSAAANSVIAVARPTSAITTSLAFAYGFHIDIDTASLPDRWSSLFSDYEVDYNSNHATMPRHAERNAATFRSSIAHILTEARVSARDKQVSRPHHLSAFQAHRILVTLVTKFRQGEELYTVM